MKLWRRSTTSIFYVVWMENGVQRKKSLGTKDKIVAKRLFNQFHQALIAGKIKPIFQGNQIKFYAYCDEFLNYIDTTKTHSTFVLYRVALEKAKKSWGDISLNHLTQRHFDSFISDLVKSGLSSPTVNKNARHVKAALNKAYQWEYLKKPIRFSKQLKEESELRYLTGEQLASFLAVIDDPEFADFCLFAALTGLRSGEIIRLTWSDIDNPAGFMRISPKQKNKTEYRIPINSDAREILNRYLRQLGPVFRFKCLTWISQKFKKYAMAAGLGGHRFHDLRHAFGTQMVKAGVDIITLQKLMRHKSINSTLVYSKVLPEHLIEASNKIDYGLPKIKKIK